MEPRKITPDALKRQVNADTIVTVTATDHAGTRKLPRGQIAKRECGPGPGRREAPIWASGAFALRDLNPSILP